MPIYSPSPPLPPHLFSIVFTTSLQANSGQKLDPSIKGREKECDGLHTSNESSDGSYLCLKCVPALGVGAHELPIVFIRQALIWTSPYSICREVQAFAFCSSTENCSGSVCFENWKFKRIRKVWNHHQVNKHHKNDCF